METLECQTLSEIVQNAYEDIKEQSKIYLSMPKSTLHEMENKLQRKLDCVSKMNKLLMDSTVNLQNPCDPFT